MKEHYAITNIVIDAFEHNRMICEKFMISIPTGVNQMILPVPTCQSSVINHMQSLLHPSIWIIVFLAHQIEKS